MTKPRYSLSLYKQINTLVIFGILMTVGIGFLNYSNLDVSKKAAGYLVSYFSSLGITLLAFCALFFLENKVTKYIQVLLIFLTGIFACLDNPLAFDCVGLWSICFMLGFGHGLIRSFKIVKWYIAVTLAIFILSLILNKDLTRAQFSDIAYFLIFYVIHLVALLAIVKTKIDDSALVAKAGELDRFFSTELDLFCILDGKGRFIRANPEWGLVFGYCDEELKAMTILEIIHPADLPFVTISFTPKKAAQEAVCSTLRCRCKNGSYRYVELRSTQHDSVLYVAARDITVRIEHESQLQKNLVEKNILIKELYHRTKNNMQVIMSIIYLKAFNHPDSRVNATLEDINQRIATMALAQQLLYKSSDLSRINMKEYLRLLSDAILSNNSWANGRISFTQECVDLELLIDEAIPCGLLINELLTNSYKHAFPESGTGSISLSFTAFADKRLLLQYADDGVGLPEDFNLETSTSFGLSLVKSLSEYQLAGTLNIKREGGLGFSISFPINTHKERVFHEYPAG